MLVDDLNEQVEKVLETLNKIHSLGLPLVHGGGPDSEDNHLYLDLKSFRADRSVFDSVLLNEDIAGQWSEGLRKCLQNNFQASAWCVLLDKSPLRPAVSFYVGSYPTSEVSENGI